MASQPTFDKPVITSSVDWVSRADWKRWPRALATPTEPRLDRVYPKPGLFVYTAERR